MKRNFNKGRSAPKLDSFAQRKNLIKKLSEAIKIKYNNVFTVAKYDDNTLKNDIDKLLSTQYCNKDPREVFKPIETDILKIVKTKNPQLKIQVKKARKLPEIKYKLDKYQEADAIGEHDFNTEPNKLKDKTKSKSKPTLKKANTVNKKKENSCIDVEVKKDVAVSEVVENKNCEDKNNLEGLNTEVEEIKESPVVQDTMYRIEQTYGTPHKLVDRYREKMKYYPTSQSIAEENLLYEKEKKLQKQQKMEAYQKYLDELKIQIEEKNKRIEKERQRELLELEEIYNQVKIEKEEDEKKKQEERIKQQKLMEKFEKEMIEKKNLDKQKKQKEIEELNKFLAQEKNELTYEQKTYLDRKNRIFKEVRRIQELQIAEKKKNAQNQIVEEEEDGEIFLKNRTSNKVIQDRVNRIAKKQEAASNFLKKIYALKEKKNDDMYIIEREKQEQKKKLELENADKDRQKKMDEIRKCLEENMLIKSMEKEKRLKEEIKMKEDAEKEYALYLKEEEEKKRKEIEKYENYRKALEEQIKENREMEYDKMKMNN